MFNSQLMIILANKDKINCIFGILLGKGNVEKRCRKFPELLEIARKGSLNEEDIIKIAGILEKIGLRGVNTRELVTKLLDVKRELENKNVSDVLEGLAIALTVMTGVPVKPEELKQINEVVGMINCLKPDMSVDVDCLDKAGIPSEFKNAFITTIATGSVLASTIIDED